MGRVVVSGTITWLMIKQKLLLAHQALQEVFQRVPAGFGFGLVSRAVAFFEFAGGGGAGEEKQSFHDIK